MSRHRTVNKDGRTVAYGFENLSGLGPDLFLQVFNSSALGDDEHEELKESYSTLAFLPSEEKVDKDFIVQYLQEECENVPRHHIASIEMQGRV